MVQTTVNDYTKMIGELKEGMDLAEVHLTSSLGGFFVSQIS
jgi:hypothetical protein